MNIRASQYGSLTGSRVYRRYASGTKVLTVPAGLAVPLSLAKDVLRKYDTADDTHIELLIKATTEQVERACKTDFRRKERLAYWLYPKPVIQLPYGPHESVTEVKAINESGEETVLVEGEDYEVDGLDTFTISTNRYYHALEVIYQSGYDPCPDAVKGAIIQELSFQYKNRNDPNVGTITIINGLTAEARSLLIAGGYFSYG